MKKARIILSIVACLFAVVGSFASRADKSFATYYGVTGGSCTTGNTTETCSSTNTGLRCTVTTDDAAVNHAAAFQSIVTSSNPDQCVTPVFRP